MSLLEVRKKFVRETGRFDLVVDSTNFANSTNPVTGGADGYIQDGQDFLDRRINFYKEEAELEVSLATSAFTSNLSNIRAIRAVSLFDSSDDEMVYLKRSSLREMREAYGDEKSSLANVEKGQPNHWTIGFLRDGLTVSAATQIIKDSAVQLVVMPPADRTYTLRVQALLRSSALTSDDSVSFWTENHPQALVWAAQYLLEVSYRNQEGARALLAHIDNILEGIDNDLVEQEIVEQSHPKSMFRFIDPPRKGIERHLS